MTKADIVERIAVNIGIPKKEAADMLESVLAILKTTIETGEKVKIAGFGNFVVKEKADRRGRNPQTGEAITINARRILTFKPSQVLKAKINTAPPIASFHPETQVLMRAGGAAGGSPCC